MATVRQASTLGRQARKLGLKRLCRSQRKYDARHERGPPGTLEQNPRPCPPRKMTPSKTRTRRRAPECAMSQRIEKFLPLAIFRGLAARGGPAGQGRTPRGPGKEFLRRRREGRRHAVWRWSMKANTGRLAACPGDASPQAGGKLLLAEQTAYSHALWPQA
jgi:hypothetical protein